MSATIAGVIWQRCLTFTLRRRACVALLCTLLPVLGAQAAGLPRIEILGQSQTLGWFEQLEIPVYQGRFVLGSGFYQWAEPEHSIWQTEVSTVNGVRIFLNNRLLTEKVKPGGLG